MTQDFRFESFDHAKHQQLLDRRKAEGQRVVFTAVAVVFWVLACAGALGLALVQVAAQMPWFIPELLANLSLMLRWGWIPIAVVVAAMVAALYFFDGRN